MLEFRVDVRIGDLKLLFVLADEFLLRSVSFLRFRCDRCFNCFTNRLGQFLQLLRTQLLAVSTPNRLEVFPQFSEVRVGLAFLPLDLGLLGTPPTVLAALSSALDTLWDEPLAERARQRQAALVATRDDEAGVFARQLERVAGSTPMTALEAVATVARSLPPRAVLVDESITASGEVARAFALGDGGDYFAGRGGGIGQGLAGALGVAVAQPHRPIVALSGDGSAMYSIQALWTAAHHGLDIVFVILSNREYRILKHNMDTYRERFGIVTDKPYPHMNLAEPRLGFCTMAQGMGLRTREVDSAAALGTALTAGTASANLVAADRFHVIVAVPVSTWVRKNST